MNEQSRSHAPRRWILALACAASVAAAASAQPASPEVRAMHRWVLETADHAGAPFLVLDKRRAHVWVFDDRGRELGHSPVLLGLAPGDHSVPGIGERPIKDIRPEERTTPAGRFVLEAGHNAKGEDIFWVDYDAAVSMHRVRPNDPRERRLQRLATPTPADNRISYGCINVPTDFYERVVRRVFLRTSGVAYVLPETRPLDSMRATLTRRPRVL